MKISNKGIALIKEYEGCKLKAYTCSAGVWTIGYGHTRGGKAGDVITQAQADAFFLEDIKAFERDVNSLLKVPVTQGMFDALVSFAFNVGSDIDADTIAEGLGDSTLLKKVNAGDKAGAANEFAKWNKAAGKVVSGLVRRREAERKLFLS